MTRPNSDSRQDSPTAERASAAFDSIAREMLDRDAITIGAGKRGFGSNALCVHGRIFAMVSGGGLVMKLPRDRVAALLASGEGTPFDAGKGRPMKEWVTLANRPAGQMLALAEEAAAFVGGRS